MKHKKSPNQRAFKIVHKTQIVMAKPAEEPIPEVDTAKAVAFAMSIAQEMKQRQRQADAKEKEAEKKRPAGRNKRYSEAELKTFKNKLLEVRERTTSNSTAMKSSIGIEELDDFEPDGGDGTSQTLRLHTMNQIDDGSYGVCVSCGQLISRNRLLSSPFVKTCTDCQQALEQR